MSWTHLSLTYPKAKRKHVCTFCGKWIGKGQVNAKNVAVDGGDFSTVRAHKRCWDYVIATTEIWDQDFDEFDKKECDKWYRNKKRQERLASTPRIGPPKGYEKPASGTSGVSARLYAEKFVYYADKRWKRVQHLMWLAEYAEIDKLRDEIDKDWGV